MMKTGSIWALGAMSGTSLDGVDAALVLTDGHRIEAFGDTAYRPYPEAERAAIRAALGQWPEGPDVAAAARAVEKAHAEVLAPLAPRAALVGFHGQTLAHDPAGRGTHQAGDGARLAELLQKPVVWDFRSADVRLGGQGAPLAPFFHFACAHWTGARRPVVFLNLGGVGNLTWVDPAQPAPDVPGACLAFDTGPANAPVNDLVTRRLDLSHDEAGRLAGEGAADEAIVADFLAHPYFLKMPPKSLDRNDFHGLLDRVAGLSDADAAATLTLAAAAAVGRGADHFPSPPERILVTGGGRHNLTLMAMLDDLLDAPVAPVEDAGLNGDMLEAQAFGYLAVRVARGLPTSCPGTTGVAAAVGGGQIATPS
ncbi:MAG: anhydro-N-acetylmuramic acid kinase [Rhodobacteraceae bacterium]|nr:anhydro-N-acetylmuramic acid kinase [Paracoccaceae bacterium]MCC0046822.1 anhydro-N-acetylmuramic acid kinase [Defluviimonas sp.]